MFLSQRCFLEVNHAVVRHVERAECLKKRVAPVGGVKIEMGVLIRKGSFRKVRTFLCFPI